MDVLNIRALYPSANEWGIPDLAAFVDGWPAADRKDDGPNGQSTWPNGHPAGSVPERLVPWNSRFAHEHPDRRAALHFFLDDYRFETVWTRVDQSLAKAQAYGTALTPDFSLWLEMPLAMQVWQTYRNRWIGAHWQAHGVTVIPTITWAGPPSYPFCFAGVDQGAIVAVSSVGSYDTDFRDGWHEMLARINPSRILVYGRILACMEESRESIMRYPSRWERQSIDVD
jgi:Domain of unknown function (DUF4417)